MKKKLLVNHFRDQLIAKPSIQDAYLRTTELMEEAVGAPEVAMDGGTKITDLVYQLGNPMVDVHDLVCVLHMLRSEGFRTKWTEWHMMDEEMEDRRDRIDPFSFMPGGIKSMKQNPWHMPYVVISWVWP